MNCEQQLKNSLSFPSFFSYFTFKIEVLKNTCDPLCENESGVDNFKNIVICMAGKNTPTAVIGYMYMSKLWGESQPLLSYSHLKLASISFLVKNLIQVK